MDDVDPPVPLSPTTSRRACARPRSRLSSSRTRCRSSPDPPSATPRSTGVDARPDPPARGRAARPADRRQRPGARRGRPAGARLADRDLAGERGGPLPARRRSPRRTARPELQRRRPLPDRRRGPLLVRDDQARLLPVAQPPERLAAGAHPLLALRARVLSAARDADVLPRRPALPVRPDLRLGARPAGSRAADLEVRPRRRRCPSGRSGSASTSCCAASAATPFEDAHGD